MADDYQLARTLGWFSLGLGLAQVTVPGEVARFIGIRDEDSSRSLMRLVGLRELACGVGILTQDRPAGWLWARAAGDAMDLALLGSAFGSDDVQRERVGAATAAVLGLAALDMRTGSHLGQQADGQQMGGQQANGQQMASQQANGSPHPAARGIEVRRAITIKSPAAELYRFWRDFTNLPRFMRHLEAVEVLDERHSRWTAKAPAGMNVTWEAEITDDRPDEMIAWQSLPGASVPNVGSVRFTSAPGDRGTEVHVHLRYDPPGGKLGATVAKLFGEEPDRQVNDDLRALKQVFELGEVVESDASIHGHPHPAQPPEHPVTA